VTVACRVTADPEPTEAVPVVVKYAYAPLATPTTKTAVRTDAKRFW
jgi:hypothetical protein